ncbi:MAG TPA: cell division protein FtsQ/DivIB [Burkholderiales bacterium]|jgi:cell division protein FtsQ|nr:cell division protein FtsQ/DivIB [Burkholderiales bacterium]
MWDNPRLLNLAANVLFAVALAILGAAALQTLVRSPLFPVREVEVQGALKHALRADLEHAAAGLGGNFFALDLRAVRGRFEQVPWVRHVDVRRVWPDRVEAKIEEHVALARWGDDALVNTHGERFVGRNEEALPFLAGPAGSEALVAGRYRRFVEILAPLGESVERVVLTPRHAWQLRLASGLTLELGRDGTESVEQRLARFVAVFPETLGRLARRDAASFPHVDLRYPNGFALRVAGWKG